MLMGNVVRARWAGCVLAAVVMLAPGPEALAEPALDAPDAQPVVESAAVPSVLDSGRTQIVRASVTSRSAQGIASVQLNLLGTSVPMTRGADGRYTTELAIPPVATKTHTRPSISVLDGNGLTAEHHLNETTVWPSGNPVLHSVVPGTTLVEPGDQVRVRARVTSDSSRGAQQVLVYSGQRGVGVLRPAPGGFHTGTVHIGDELPGSTLKLTATAEDGYGKRSGSVPFELRVAASSKPQIVASRVNPHGGVLIGQPISLDLEATSEPGLKAARLTVAGARSVGLPRVSGDAQHGVYRGTWTPPGIGEYTVALEAVDINGRKAARSLTIKVVGEATAEVAAVDGPKKLSVTPGWAMLTITAAAKGQVDHVWVQCGATTSTLTRVSGPTFRQTISLAPDTAPGRLDCAVRAVDAAGLASAPKHLFVQVKRVSTFEKFKVGRRLTGSLHAVDGSGGAYGHLNDAKVRLMFRKAGSSTYRRMATVVTSGHGEFSKKLPTRARGRWKAVYAGSADYAGASSAHRSSLGRSGT